MKETVMLNILDKLEWLIVRNRTFEAKKVLRIELDNLKGITQKNCSNTIYYFYDWACKYCQNVNCESNKSI